MWYLSRPSVLEATSSQDSPYFPGATRTTRDLTAVHELSGQLPAARDVVATPGGSSQAGCMSQQLRRDTGWGQWGQVTVDSFPSQGL